MEDSEVINFSALERELQAALEADKKYRRENDAKFRAIHQNVGSYEEFRNIVLASHLKPIERKDTASNSRKQPWNSIASATRPTNSLQCDMMEAAGFHPRTAAEFSRDWRRFAGSAEDRYQLLISLGGENLQQIFHAEIGSGLLGEFLLILSKCLQSGDVVTVVTILEGMTRTGRFGLNVSFLSQVEQDACLTLFHSLLNVAGDDDSRTNMGQAREQGSTDGDTTHICPPLDIEAAKGENLVEKLKPLMKLYGVHAYEAPEDKEDVFARRACPAFLVFESAAYLEDMTIELPCHCKPTEAHSVVWYYQKHLRSEKSRVLTDFDGTVLVDSSQVGRKVDQRSRFSIRLFSLLVFRVQEADSGHYVCGTATGQFFYGYDVDVQQARRVSFPRRPGAPNPNPRRTEGPDGQYIVFTSFWPWSVCDRCGVPGEQTRVGLCYMHSEYLNVRYIRDTSKPTTAPCGSAAVPQRFKLEGKRGAELAVRGCTATCPPEPEEMAEQKTLLEFLGFEETVSRVPVYYHNHPIDSPLVLACPGAKPQHAVAWDQGKQPLYRAEYMEGLNKTARVYIDAGHHLHFSPVQLEDQGSYYCWLQGKLAAEIRLGVYLRLGRRRQFSDPESVYALRAIILCYALYTLIFVIFVVVRFCWRSLKRKVV
ncbi:hypothetical protein JZ751_013174 [Albula glossodonta]|uniref:Ig-like domain-containing protein n=1 Tax=Albula glossodonta TaxID=121402 RepID=A0A8T2NS83_9TELE|nr:hypothetical protein JZ751_013174 [Albula glossodonta]